MTRLAMLPEVRFAEDFRQLRRDIEEIKNAQRIGRDIMRPKIIECLDINGDPTEYDLVTVSDGSFSSTDYTAVFTAQNQSEPWGTLFVKAYYGAPGVPVEAGKMSGNAYLSAGSTAEGLMSYSGFISTFDFGDTTTLYLKFYMYATDNGILEVTPEYIQ